MNKIVITLIMGFLSIISTAQYNVPVFDEENYCHHIKSALQGERAYFAPQETNWQMDHYDVTFYFLDLEVENDTTYISGNVTIKAKSVVASLDTFAIELFPGMVISSLTVDGIPHEYSRNGYEIMVPLLAPIAMGEYFSVNVAYQGTPPTGGFFSGVSTAYDAGYDKHVTWTLSEPYAAKDWWPAKQVLADKADSVYVFLTTSSTNMAGSQGLLTAVTPVAGGKLRYEWKSYYPINYYLISFAVADYQEYNIYAHPEGLEGDSILIQNFIYDHPNCLPDNQAGIHNTAAFLELFSDLFGMYPFAEEKYGHCLAEIGGGMEHQTMTTLGSFSFGLVAHELGHMWFGDKVTCATWSDIWINEGFATYSDYLAHSYLSTPYYDSLWLKIRNDHVKSIPGGSVYVPEDQLGDIWRIFDGRLSYSKGALLLHMIRFELQDDDLFFNVLESFVIAYGDSVATGDDFREWLELQSGKDFTDFFNQWYYGEGYPVYDISWYHDGDTLDITSVQTTSAAVTPLFKMTVPYHVRFTDGSDTTLLLYQDANFDAFQVPLTGSLELIEVDPEQWILHKLNSITVGLGEQEQSIPLSIGPNPARDRLSVFLPDHSGTAYRLIISDLSGRPVFEKMLGNASETADISKLAAGIYQVTVTDGKEHVNRKLIVE